MCLQLSDKTISRLETHARQRNCSVEQLINTLLDKTASRSDVDSSPSDHHYRLLFEMTADAIFIHDMQGHFLNVNQVACKRLGYSRDNLLKMTCTDINTPYYAALVPDRIQQIIESGQAKFEPISETLLIKADKLHLERAIGGILNNALIYIPPGGHISVKSYAHQSCACVEIQDTGIGISKAELPYIFERFYRVDKARGTEHGGSGLGLAIARKIIQVHRGQIEVESKLGHGSLFRIRLPLFKNVS